MRHISPLLILVFVLLSAVPSSWAASKKILYVDSYHREYPPNILARKSFLKEIKEKDVVVRFVFMDAKHKKLPEELQKEALRIRDIISDWHPDLLVAADDAANKYLIVPYFKKSSLPIVFNGINWHASEYGYPTATITGQIEINLLPQLIKYLEKIAHGKRIGLLMGDTLTDRKSLEAYEKSLQLTFTHVDLVSDFEEWQKHFIDLQKKVDLLILRNNAGIRNWDDRKALRFVKRHTAIPTGSVAPHLKKISLICLPKMHEEFGEISAKMAIDILFGGKLPQEIPVVTNKKTGLYLNLGLAKRLGITFPLELLENAHLITAAKKKLLLVNSYHKGYDWSDGVEKGLLKSLAISANADGSFDDSNSEVSIRVFRMDTKINHSETFKKQAALTAKAIIDEWHPDIVVTSDDNAVKYLLVPYYRDASIPFVYCGVNWDDSVYGLPFTNTTGMIEVAPGKETIALLRPYAKGERVGYLGSNTLSEHRNIDHFTKQLNITFADGSLVDTYSQWQEEFLRLQNTVDMLLWFNPIGIKGWDEKSARQFLLANTKIPTGGTSDNHIHLALLGRVKIAEEQGWWAGNTALKILDDIKPSDIPPTHNKESIIYLNMQLAKQMGIKFPLDLIEQARFVDETN